MIWILVFAWYFEISFVSDRLFTFGLLIWAGWNISSGLLFAILFNNLLLIDNFYGFIFQKLGQFFILLLISLKDSSFGSVGVNSDIVLLKMIGSDDLSGNVEWRDFCGVGFLLIWEIW